MKNLDYKLKLRSSYSLEKLYKQVLNNEVISEKDYGFLSMQS